MALSDEDFGAFEASPAKPQQRSVAAASDEFGEFASSPVRRHAHAAPAWHAGQAGHAAHLSPGKLAALQNGNGWTLPNGAATNHHSQQRQQQGAPKQSVLSGPASGPLPEDLFCEPTDGGENASARSNSPPNARRAAAGKPSSPGGSAWQAERLYERGALVWYRQRDGSYAAARVVAVDKALSPPSYGIEVLGGVRETEGARLRARRAGDPPPAPGSPAPAVQPGPSSPLTRGAPGHQPHSPARLPQSPSWQPAAQPQQPPAWQPHSPATTGQQQGWAAEPLRGSPVRQGQQAPFAPAAPTWQPHSPASPRPAASAVLPAAAPRQPGWAAAAAASPPGLPGGVPVHGALANGGFASAAGGHRAAHAQPYQQAGRDPAAAAQDDDDFGSFAAALPGPAAVAPVAELPGHAASSPARQWQQAPGPPVAAHLPGSPAAPRAPSLQWAQAASLNGGSGLPYVMPASSGLPVARSPPALAPADNGDDFGDFSAAGAAAGPALGQPPPVTPPVLDRSAPLDPSMFGEEEWVADAPLAPLEAPPAWITLGAAPATPPSPAAASPKASAARAPRPRSAAVPATPASPRRGAAPQLPHHSAGSAMLQVGPAPTLPPVAIRAPSANGLADGASLPATPGTGSPVAADAHQATHMGSPFAAHGPGGAASPSGQREYARSRSLPGSPHAAHVEPGASPAARTPWMQAAAGSHGRAHGSPSGSPAPAQQGVASPLAAAATAAAVEDDFGDFAAAGGSPSAASQAAVASVPASPSSSPVRMLGLSPSSRPSMQPPLPHAPALPSIPSAPALLTVPTAAQGPAGALLTLSGLASPGRSSSAPALDRSAPLPLSLFGEASPETSPTHLVAASLAPLRTRSQQLPNLPAAPASPSAATAAAAVAPAQQAASGAEGADDCDFEWSSAPPAALPAPLPALASPSGASTAAPAARPPAAALASTATASPASPSGRAAAGLAPAASLALSNGSRSSRGSGVAQAAALGPGLDAEDEFDDWAEASAAPGGAAQAAEVDAGVAPYLALVELPYFHAWTRLLQVCAQELQCGHTLLAAHGSALAARPAGAAYLAGLGQVWLVVTALRAAAKLYAVEVEDDYAFVAASRRCETAWTGADAPADSQPALGNSVAAVLASTRGSPASARSPPEPERLWGAAAAAAAQLRAQGLPQRFDTDARGEPRRASLDRIRSSLGTSPPNGGGGSGGGWEWRAGLCAFCLLPLEPFAAVGIAAVPWAAGRPCLAPIANLWIHRVAVQAPQLSGPSECS